MNNINHNCQLSIFNCQLVPNINIEINCKISIIIWERDYFELELGTLYKEGFYEKNKWEIRRIKKCDEKA